MLGLMRNTPNRRPKVALVLGAGGIKTACHLGLLRVLQRENIPIDLVVGSSGGSLFGASYALGIESSQIEHWVRVYWRSELFRDYGYRQLVKMLSPRRFRFDENFFPVVNQGELAVVYCFLFFFMVFAGSGAWSVDAKRGRPTF